MRAGGLRRQDAQRVDQHAQRHQGKAVEAALPVEGGLQPGADQWRKRHKRAAQGHVIQAYAGAILLIEQVLHQRVAQYKEPTTHCLHTAKQQKAQVVLRQCAADGTEDRQADAADQHFLAPPFIRQRPGHQLGDRKNQREQADGQCDIGGGRIEVGGQGRKRGQQDIDREEADQGDAGDEDEARKGGPRHCFCFPEVEPATDTSLRKMEFNCRGTKKRSCHAAK